MKNKIITLLSLCLISGTLQAETYNLNQYLELVQNHSKQLKLAQEDKELANIQKKEAVASALPMIGLNSGYTRNLTDYYMYFDMSALQPGATGVVKAPVKRDNEFSASVGLEQTLFSPTVGSALKAANQYKNLTDHVYKASEQAIENGAKKLFYQCLLLEKVWDVTKATEKNALENYENMKLRFENGQISKLDLLQAETRWRSAVPETQKAERNVNMVLNTFKNMAGLTPDENIELNGSFNTIPQLPEEIQLETVLEKRPDFNALLWEQKLRKTAVGAAKGSFLPTIKGNVAYAYSAQSNEFELDEENKLWMAGVTLSLPIFTGGYRVAQVQKNQVELNKTKLRIDQTQEDIYKELVDVHLRLKEAHNRIESAKATKHVAEKAFEISETTTKNGLTTQLELKDARLMFDQATLNYYAATYDYLAAWFDWQLATGHSDNK